MKKILRGVLAAVVSVGYLTTAVAGAQSGGCTGATITNTGPDSSNTVTCVDSSTVNVTCVNNVYAVTNNSQTSSTGSASSTGNTNGGNSVSGNATNSNGQTVQIGASCGSPAATATPTNPGTPSTGLGQVEGASTTKVAVLPYTASGSIAPVVGVIVAGIAGLAVLSRLAVLAYRHSLLK